MDHKMAERNFYWNSVAGGIKESKGKKIEFGRAFKNWARCGQGERWGKGVPEVRNTTA